MNRMIYRIGSPQERDIRVRSVNPYMASRAVLETRIRHVVEAVDPGFSGALTAEIPRPVMTFQAHGEDDRAPQEPRIRRSVRHVTRLAAIHSYGRVFVYERTPLLRVTFETRLLVRERLRHHARTRSHVPGRMECSMRIVTIR